MRTSTLGFVFVVLNAIAGCAGGGDDGGGDPTPDAASNTPVCGDGTCAAAEVGVCPQDCGSTTTPVCGDGTCKAPQETNTNCPADCQATGPICGDGTCDMAGGENTTNCPGDCGGNQGALDCQAQETILGCFACILDPATGCAPPYTETDCNACFAM